MEGEPQPAVRKLSSALCEQTPGRHTPLPLEPLHKIPTTKSKQGNKGLSGVCFQSGHVAPCGGKEISRGENVGGESCLPPSGLEASRKRQNPLWQFNSVSRRAVI